MKTRSTGSRRWTRDEWIGAGIYVCVASLSIVIAAVEASIVLGVTGTVMLASARFVPEMRRHGRRPARA